MASIWDPLIWIYLQLSVHMYPVGDFSWLVGPGYEDNSAPAQTTPMTASYLFNAIRTDKGMHVNILALLSAVLIGVQALLGSRRRRLGRKALVRLPLWAFYTISFPVVSYTIGLIQSVEAKAMPDSQLLWAVVLLLLLGSVNGMSAFSRQDIEQSKGMLANHAVQTLLVLWLLISRSDISSRWVLLAYFLLCWIYSIFRMAQRMTALRKASSAHGLVRSATVVGDYMKGIVKDKEHDPKNLHKCKYLVHGEEKDFKPPSEPPYLATVGSKVVTVGMIWEHKGKLLLSGDGDKWSSQRALKDTCLSFALFKLLKRRFCGDLDIAEAGDPKTVDFVVDGLLANGREEGYDYERAFRVVEVELSFLYDFFYTNYPVLFPTNRLLGVLRFFVLLGFFKVLLADFIVDAFVIWALVGLEYYKPEYNFIFFNDILVVVMILSIDILQHLASRYSNWAIVQFVCDYVNNTREEEDWRNKRRCWSWKPGCGIRRALLKWVAARRWRKAHYWDNKLGQYLLLKSYDYNPDKTWKNTLSRLSLRMMEPTGQGRREETAVPLAATVKKVVLDCLKETRGLPSVGRSFKESARQLKLPLPPCVTSWSPFWACDDLPTHTHTVLVWHIATTMCDLQDSGKRDGDRLVATTLSGYCAYLLAFVPDMLPDNSYKAGQILDAVVEEARDLLGADTKDMQERCAKMFELGKKGTSSSQVQDKQGSPEPKDVKDTKILILGARLGWQLKQSVKEPAQRWKLLARFWAELVLFLAPSNNADIHAEHLANGGEFITHLWALLTHAGIVERPPDASPV